MEMWKSGSLWQPYANAPISELFALANKSESSLGESSLLSQELLRRTELTLILGSGSDPAELLKQIDLPCQDKLVDGTGAHLWPSRSTLNDLRLPSFSLATAQQIMRILPVLDRFTIATNWSADVEFASLLYLLQNYLSNLVDFAFHDFRYKTIRPHNYGVLVQFINEMPQLKRLTLNWNYWEAEVNLTICRQLKHFKLRLPFFADIVMPELRKLARGNADLRLSLFGRDNDRFSLEDFTIIDAPFARQIERLDLKGVVVYYKVVDQEAGAPLRNRLAVPQIWTRFTSLKSVFGITDSMDCNGCLPYPRIVQGLQPLTQLVHLGLQIKGDYSQLNVTGLPRLATVLVVELDLWPSSHHILDQLHLGRVLPSMQQLVLRLYTTNNCSGCDRCGFVPSPHGHVPLSLNHMDCLMSTFKYHPSLKQIQLELFSPYIKDRAIFKQNIIIVPGGCEARFDADTEKTIFVNHFAKQIVDNTEEYMQYVLDPEYGRIKEPAPAKKRVQLGSPSFEEILQMMDKYQSMN